MVTTSFAGPGLIQYDAVSSWQEGRTAVQMEVPVQWPRIGWRGSAAARKRSAVRASVVFMASAELYARFAETFSDVVALPHLRRKYHESPKFSLRSRHP